MNDDLIARLAAANPVPSDTPIHGLEPTRLPIRRLALGNVTQLR